MEVPLLEPELDDCDELPSPSSDLPNGQNGMEREKFGKMELLDLTTC